MSQLVSCSAERSPAPAAHPSATDGESAVEIKTVKLDRDKRLIEIAFTRPNGSALESVSFPCKDTPRKQFVEAMKELDADFKQIMSQPGDNECRVLGVHFGSKGGRDHFQLLGGLTVEAGFSSLNTPLLWEPTPELIQSGAALAVDQVKRLRKLEAEAVKYVEGQRTEEPEEQEEGEEEATVSKTAH